MKRTMTAIVSALFLFLPITGLAAYIIHLKDGREFITERYTEEGDQIIFKVYGGLIGIQKDLVRDIEETAADVPEKTVVRVEPEVPEAGAEAEPKDNAKAAPSGAERVDKTNDKAEKKEGKQPAEITEEERKKAEQERAERIQALLDEKRQIMREMEEANSAFKEAKASRDERKKNQYWNELLSLQKKLGALRNRAAAENGGQVPDWWDQW